MLLCISASRERRLSLCEECGGWFMRVSTDRDPQFKRVKVLCGDRGHVLARLEALFEKCASHKELEV